MPKPTRAYHLNLTVEADTLAALAAALTDAHRLVGNGDDCGSFRADDSHGYWQLAVNAEQTPDAYEKAREAWLVEVEGLARETLEANPAVEWSFGKLKTRSEAVGNG